MPIFLKRACEPPAPEDGYRVLVDRLWPRGISKERVELDEWLQAVAPSDELRRWFGHDRSRWTGFRNRYLGELRGHREELRRLAERARRERVTLVFGAKDEEHNNAVVVKQYLRMLQSARPRSHAAGRPRLE